MVFVALFLMIGIGLVVRCAGITIVLELSNLIIIGSVSAFLCSEIIRGYGLTIKSNLRLFQTEEKRLICMIYVYKIRLSLIKGGQFHVKCCKIACPKPLSLYNRGPQLFNSHPGFICLGHGHALLKFVIINSDLVIAPTYKFVAPAKTGSH